MEKLKPSMRTNIGMIVLIMGVLGMLLAIATGETYRHLALKNQQTSFVALAKLKVDEIIEDLAQESIELGLSAQASQGFHLAFNSKDPAAISAQLNEHFHRAYVTLGRVKLVKIIALDKTFHPIASSSEGDPNISNDKPACTDFINNVANRTLAARLKPDSQLCRIDGKSVLASLVAIGGLRVKGYLQIIVDPGPNLTQVGKGLGTPMRLSSIDKSVIYESDDWPKMLNKNILLTEYDLQSTHDQALLILTFATDITTLQKQLSTTRNIILSIAAVIILSATLLALMILQRTTLTPLNTLTKHLRRVQEDKSQLGEKVIVSGNAEIADLATDFNKMSSELSALYRTLESMAFTDPLTDMPNRTLFFDRLEQAVLTATRYSSHYIVMMMDLDRFKNINDTLGHHIGDQLLKTVGERLHEALRKSDSVARLGGDEFAALLPAIDNEGNGAIVAQKIVNAMNEPIIVNGHSLSVGISIGMARCPQDGDNVALLMQRADIAMYHAKREGLGYAFYEQSMDGDNLFELTMESELRQAVENKNFDLYFQPKIDIQQDCVTGAEALIRWTHDEQGFISPEKFIPLAEQSGLIQPLTEWVLGQALSQVAAWHASGIKIGVSVNLSAYSLNDIALLDSIRLALAKAKIDPQWLTLELTETAIMSDADRALSTLSRLNSMGVNLSVDDFGTGYSSLAYLKRFPVNEIKIDKSFVMEMVEDVSDAVIVRSTIDLAHNMGMEVCAEGIESQAAWDQLAELGCNRGQGYFMCRPCPAEDFNQWIKESRWGLNKLKTAK